MGTKPTGEQMSRIMVKFTEINRQLCFQKDGYPYDLDALDRTLQMIIEGKFGFIENVPISPPPKKTILVPVKIGPRLNVGDIGTTPDMLTKDCFRTKSRYYHRDVNLDNWLPENQPAGKEGFFSVNQLDLEANFLGMLAEALGTDADADKISTLLIEGGHIWTLTQIEAKIEQRDKAENVGVRMNGRANLFPVLNKDGTISVVNVNRDNGLWGVFIHRIISNSRLWREGCHLFLRNP